MIKKINIIIVLMLFSPVLFAGDKCTILYFIEKDCPDCANINKAVIPLIKKKYGKKIEIIKRDVEKTKNFEAMMAFEGKYGMLPQEVPEFYTSFGVTWKPDKISEELPKLIERELATKEKGKYFEFLDNYLTTGDTGISLAESIRKQYLGKQHRLKVYEFRKPGCKSCDRLSISMRYLKQKFPKELEIETRNITDNETKILNEALCIKYNIPDEMHLTTPALFFGNNGYAGKPAFKNLDVVKLILEALKEADKNPTPELTKSDFQAAKDAIYKRYTSISPLKRQQNFLMVISSGFIPLSGNVLLQARWLQPNLRRLLLKLKTHRAVKHVPSRQQPLLLNFLVTWYFPLRRMKMLRIRMLKFSER